MFTEMPSLCQCGCGRPTQLATRNRAQQGHVKGQPLPLLPGHSRARPATREASRPGLKICGRCDEEKPAAEFPLDPRRSTGRYPYCLPCKTAYMTERRRSDPAKYAKADHLRRLPKRYGITSDEYLRLLAAQDDACAICRRPASGAGRRLGVDHDHTTGRVRGLLCSPCNVGIGYLGDTAESVARALTYLTP